MLNRDALSFLSTAVHRTRRSDSFAGIQSRTTLRGNKEWKYTARLAVRLRRLAFSVGSHSKQLNMATLPLTSASSYSSSQTPRRNDSFEIACMYGVCLQGVLDLQFTGNQPCIARLAVGGRRLQLPLVKQNPGGLVY